jgi:hypothetical protein
MTFGTAGRKANIDTTPKHFVDATDCGRRLVKISRTFSKVFRPAFWAFECDDGRGYRVTGRSVLDAKGDKLR